MSPSAPKPRTLGNIVAPPRFVAYVGMLLLAVVAAMAQPERKLHAFLIGFDAATLRKAISRPVALLAGCYAVWALWGAGWQTSSLSLLLMCAGLPLLWWTRRSLAPAQISEPQA
jgi:hypothetical protein